MEPSRSILVRLASVVLMSAALAACEDDPVVPPRFAPLVVDVTPASIHLSECEPVQLAAQVLGGPDDVNRTVAWLSRAPDAIAVDADGWLTVTGGGDAWIIARAAADPAVMDSAFATTDFTTPTLTVRIDRITTGPDSVMVSVDSVAGVIDVAVAVRGVTACTRLDRVELSIDDAVVATRAAPPENFREVIAVDTRALHPGTGEPRWPDGPHTLRVILYHEDGDIVATPRVRLTFRNGTDP